MNKEQRKASLFTRRAFVVGAFQAAGIVILGGRLAWLQIIEGRKYKRLSDKNRINIKIIAPSRGQVVDRFGVPLAVNKQSFRVQIIPEQSGDIEKSLRTLQSVISLNEDGVQEVLSRAKKTTKFIPVVIKEDLNWEEVAKIEVNLPRLPGVSIDVGEIRSYPYGSSTAHIVGYVGLVDKNEISDNPLLALPGFKIGKTGVEKKFDSYLRGQAGVAEVEVNVIGREVRELNHKSSVAGERVSLTIDGELQRYTQLRLEKERSASAVIMDAYTGAVYALASHPGFDPNMFANGLSASAWEELLADETHPLTNKAISGQYPPASTFKMITALAGLKAGKMTASNTVFCPGFYEYGGDRFHCWKKGGHGSVNLTEALAQSCDTYFYKISTDIGIDKIAEMARMYGLGKKSGIGLPGERPGLVPDKNWKMGYHGESWKQGETIVASIGQGYFQSTPIQLAIMTARLINGGYAVKPKIFIPPEHVGMPDAWPKMTTESSYQALVKGGMDAVVNDKTGTAYSSRIADKEYAMGGKTGTAQVRKITTRQRSEGVRNEDLPWRSRHHGLFVGYAPLAKPRYVCSVVVEHGVGGSASAAPIAKDLLLEVQKRTPEQSKAGEIFEGRT